MVDLPEPDGPIASFDRQVDPPQGLERGRSRAESLGYPFQLDDRAVAHSAPALIEVTTFIPGFSSLELTTV